MLLAKLPEREPQPWESLFLGLLQVAHQLCLFLEQILVDAQALELIIVRPPDLRISPANVFEFIVLKILDLLVKLLLLQGLLSKPLLSQLDSQQLSEL